jgi:hypothetical protein
MLTAGCRDRCPATGADHVASPAVAVALAGSNTVTMATAVTATITNTIANTVTTSITTSITIAVASTVAATGSSTATPSSGSTAPSATTPTVREDRGCGQGGHHQSEHEHSESCHVAAPP